MASESKRGARGRGLFFAKIAGVGLCGIMMVGLVMGGGLAWWWRREFTVAKPPPLPVARIAPERREQLEQRIQDFVEAARNEQPTSVLVLSAEEINGLIASMSQLEWLRGRLFVWIRGNQLQGELSIPMEQVGLPLVGHRYLAGEASFEVGLRGGKLFVGVKEFSAKGKRMPEELMRWVREQNLAAGVEADPRLAIAVEHLESVEVRNGQLWIVAKQAGR